MLSGGSGTLLRLDGEVDFFAVFFLAGRPTVTVELGGGASTLAVRYHTADRARKPGPMIT